MEKFFGLRVSKNKDITAWNTTTLGTNTDMDGLAEYNLSNKDNEDLKQVKIVGYGSPWHTFDVPGVSRCPFGYGHA